MDGIATTSHSRESRRPRSLYVPVPVKFVFALLISGAWVTFSVWMSLNWLHDLAAVVGMALAIYIIGFIAWVPGFMNGFLSASILMDRRPPRRRFPNPPPISILVACYNEAETVAETLGSLYDQDYQGEVEVLLLDDGSTDDSVEIALAAAQEMMRPGFSIRVLAQEKNQGKAGVLNIGIAASQHELIVTVDADSWVFKDALRNLVQRYRSDPENTVAVAGAVLVRNSRQKLITKAQEWDYFHGIAAVKRMQSMYHGTLVAQGAFSLYERQAILDCGGLPHCVGEDIVISWALLEKGHRIGYAEDACLFTAAPDNLKQFIRQRQRWSRGLIEAFFRHWRLLFKPRMSTLFIWWNFLFLPMDLAYTLFFIPGLILAMFGLYWIAGPMTLFVLPLAFIWNAVIFRVQRRMFRRTGLEVRRNISGLITYTLFYTMILQPACVWGYISELLHFKKTWGTK